MSAAMVAMVSEAADDDNGVIRQHRGRGTRGRRAHYRVILSLARGAPNQDAPHTRNIIIR